MAGHLRQLVEASQLQELAEPWVAGPRAHRIWPASRHCQSFQDAVRNKDRQDQDRLQEGSGGNELAVPQRCVRKYISLLYGYYE